MAAVGIKLSGRHRVRPHLVLVGGIWRAVWRDRITGVRHPNAHIHFMTYSSSRGLKARQFCRLLNDGRWPPIPRDEVES